jgi:poly(A) polymerase
MFDKAKSIVKILINHGYKAVYAGGCVRDMIMGNEPNDIDIATDAYPDEVERVFNSAGYHTLSVGKAFGVIVVMIGKDEFEIATFRTDGNYSDGRRPDEVKFSTIEEDCKRRDFTINGMYYDPIKEEIIDLVNGVQDIEGKVIRFIGNPTDRINEDNLRILRAVRFASKFNFKIEDETSKAIYDNSSLIKNVSAERVCAEMEKMFSNHTRKEAIKMMFDYNLVPKEIVNIDAFDKLPKNPSNELCWAVFINGERTNNIHNKEALLKTFKLSNDKVKHVIGIINDAAKHDTVFSKSKVVDLAVVKKLYRNIWVQDACEFNKVIGKYSFASALVEVFKYATIDVNPKPLITGDDLIEMGFVKGPIFRQIKEAVENAQLREEISTVEEAMKIVNTFKGESDVLFRECDGKS